MILLNYHTLFFFQILGKMSQNLSSAAIVIGVLTVFVNSLMKICKLPTASVRFDKTSYTQILPFFRGKLGP